MATDLSDLLDKSDRLDCLYRLYDSMRRLIEDDRLTKAIVSQKHIEWVAPISNPPLLFGLAGNCPRTWRQGDGPIPNYTIGYARPPSTLTPDGGTVTIPEQVTSFRFACELGVVIGRAGENIPESAALDHVFGFVPVIDMISNHWKDVAKKGHPCQQPSFHEMMVTSYYGRGTDGFLPMGGIIVSRDEIENPYDLLHYTRLSGVLRDRCHSGSMIVGIERAISQLSKMIRLEPGAVIHMGTMGIDGVTVEADKLLTPEDTLEVEIEKVGSVVVYVSDKRENYGCA